MLRFMLNEGGFVYIYIYINIYLYLYLYQYIHIRSKTSELTENWYDPSWLTGRNLISVKLLSIYLVQRCEGRSLTLSNGHRYCNPSSSSLNRVNGVTCSHSCNTGYLRNGYRDVTCGGTRWVPSSPIPTCRRKLLLLWRTLIGAVPIITMAQSAANWRNTHTDVDRTHSLSHFTSTQLQPHGVQSAISAINVQILHRSLLWHWTSLEELQNLVL